MTKTKQLRICNDSYYCALRCIVVKAASNRALIY